jgi:hypothetical protein
MDRALAVAAMLALAVAGCGTCGKNRGLVFDPPALPDGTVGQPYHVEVKPLDTHTPVGGMSVAGEAGTLPPGVTFTFLKDQEKAVLEGTPTKAGTYEITVSAWCYGTNVSGQSGVQPYRMTIR